MRLEGGSENTVKECGTGGESKCVYCVKRRVSSWESQQKIQGKLSRVWGERL